MIIIICIKFSLYLYKIIIIKTHFQNLNLKDVPTQYWMQGRRKTKNNELKIVTNSIKFFFNLLM